MDIVDIIVILIILSCIYVYYDNKMSDLIYIKSTKDGNKYFVRNLEDKNKAVDLLSEARQNLLKLCDHLKTEKGDDEKVQRLLNKFKPENITETEGNSQYTSYSINKGEKIVLCLRSKTNPHEFIDINTLMFVAIHEISHIMTTSIGHQDEFWNNFRFLLKEATIVGIYRCEDYENKPKKYCGITVTDNPLKCVNL